MNVGKLLLSGANLLSPWMDREGDNASFQYELIQTSGSGTLTVTIWNKNSEETGDGTEIATAWTQIGSSGVYSLDVTNLKELIRFEFTAGGTPVFGETNVDGSGDVELANSAVAWVVYRMLEPTYYNKA